jgi:hypothetical protein
MRRRDFCAKLHQATSSGRLADIFGNMSFGSSAYSDLSGDSESIDSFDFIDRSTSVRGVLADPRDGVTNLEGNKTAIYQVYAIGESSRPEDETSEAFDDFGNPYIDPADPVRELRNELKQEGPFLLFIMETKISAKRMEDLQVSLGFGGCFAVDSDGLSGGIALYWSAEMDVDVKNFSPCHIDAMVKRNNSSDLIWRLTCFYGAPKAGDRHHSWRALQNLNAVTHPAWLCVGDFNETLYATEHFSRAARPEWQMRAFREVVEECSFNDL